MKDCCTKAVSNAVKVLREDIVLDIDSIVTTPINGLGMKILTLSIVEGKNE